LFKYDYQIKLTGEISNINDINTIIENYDNKIKEIGFIIAKSEYPYIVNSEKRIFYLLYSQDTNYEKIPDYFQIINSYEEITEIYFTIFEEKEIIEQTLRELGIEDYKITEDFSEIEDFE